jgi:hypothetical protein
MHSGKDGEFSPLDVEDLHDQKDQHGDHVLAAVEPIAHLVDTASDGSPGPEADLRGTARPCVVTWAFRLKESTVH